MKSIAEINSMNELPEVELAVQYFLHAADADEIRALSDYGRFQLAKIEPPPDIQHDAITALYRVLPLSPQAIRQQTDAAMTAFENAVALKIFMSRKALQS